MSSLSRFYLVGSVALVIAVLAVGLFLGGSPREERMRRLDQQRLSDLSTIRNRIDQYWNAHERLPETYSHIQSLTDPETGMPYEYRILSPLSYALCAIFVRSDNGQQQQNDRPRPIDGIEDMILYEWRHEAGHVCFTFKPTVMPKTPPIY